MKIKLFNKNKKDNRIRINHTFGKICIPFPNAFKFYSLLASYAEKEPKSYKNIHQESMAQ